MACDVAAAFPDLTGMVAAAACAPPVGPALAALTLERVKVPAGEGVGRLDVRGAELWVAVDGVASDPVVEIAAGAHLLQVGASGSRTASAAAIVVVPADGAEVLRLAILEDGARSYACEDVDLWLVDLWDAGHGDAPDLLRLAALEGAFADCVPAADAFRVGATVAEAGARAGVAPVAEHGARLAAEADRPRWDARQLASRRVARGLSLAIPAGLGLVAFGVQQDLQTDGRVPAGPFVVGGTALVLGGGWAQQAALARGGAAVGSQAAGTGVLLLSSTVLFGGISSGVGDDYPLATMLSATALGLGLVQGVENGAALARRPLPGAQ